MPYHYIALTYIDTRTSVFDFYVSFNGLINKTLSTISNID